MSFISDMSYQGCLQSIAPGNRDKNCKVLAMIHADVPCNESLLVAGKTLAVPITVLKVLSAGFGMAPYTAAKPGARAGPMKEGEIAEPMFKMIRPRERRAADYGALELHWEGDE